ncbi:MAG: EF-P 5-aminopentanol modification-associated protein YfmH [Oscillospiraceae bacterium]
MPEEIINERIGERCFRYVHKSGVTVYIAPMEGYSTACARFAVRYGSQEGGWIDAEGREHRIPDGTAHYMEHKLFESTEKDAFHLFAKTGASCNAFTSYDMTEYHFKCTSNFAENLEILIGFVLDPYFTAENVQKEMGIISQEITMYLDNPEWQNIMEMMKAAYSETPVKTDVAGTIESISEITPELLYDVYNTFYTPKNMALLISGNVDVDEVIAVCEKCLPDRPSAEIRRMEYNEPREVVCRRTESCGDVVKPLFSIGFKCAPLYGKDQLRDNACYDFLFGILFGDSSEWFSDKRKSGLINYNFSFSNIHFRGGCLQYLAGESDNPDEVYESVLAEMARAKLTPPSREDFERVRKGYYGYNLRVFNNVESYSRVLMDAAIYSNQPYDEMETYAQISYEEFCEWLGQLDENNSCLSIIRPEKEAGEEL